MSNAANLLIQGLGKAGVQVAMKDFAKSMKSMEKTTKLKGWTEFNQGLETLIKFNDGFKPISLPLQIMTANFSAATTESSIKLMNSLLDLMETEGVQAGIKGLTDLINGIITSASDVITLVTDIASGTLVLGNNSQFVIDKMAEMGMALDESSGKWITAQEALEKATDLASDATKGQVGVIDTLTESYKSGEISIEDYIDRLNDLEEAFNNSLKALSNFTESFTEMITLTFGPGGAQGPGGFGFEGGSPF
jgi:methyl-accepting chemotaxis protein